jgi:plastocyanin
MKKVFFLSVVIFTITLLSGCKKSDNMISTGLSVTTKAVTEITDTTGVSGGIINYTGTDEITARGICWSVTQNPTIAGQKTVDGSGTGQFSSNITGLTGGTSYFVRAYATLSTGTVYGDELTFTTTIKQAANEVFIQGMAFSPQTLTVAVNTTVKWTNKDAVSHTATSNTGLFDSGILGNGGWYSFQFTSTGTYQYHCSVHPGMMGTIIVQ